MNERKSVSLYCFFLFVCLVIYFNFLISPHFGHVWSGVLLVIKRVTWPTCEGCVSAAHQETDVLAPCRKSRECLVLVFPLLKDARPRFCLVVKHFQSISTLMQSSLSFLLSSLFTFSSALISPCLFWESLLVALHYYDYDYYSSSYCCLINPFYVR